MSTNKEQQLCEQEGVLIAYLYDEGQSTADRESFESHLSGCISCIDLFAEISHARFSVLEWQRGEFAQMPTPAMVIPYEGRQGDGHRWLAPLADLIRLPLWGTAAAVGLLALVITGGYFLKGPAADAPLAGISDPAGTSSVADERVTVSEPTTETPAQAPLASVRRAARVTARVPSTKPSVVNERSTGRSLTVAIHRRHDPVPPRIDEARRKPALTTFEDDDDPTPRLADLFDDGGV